MLSRKTVLFFAILLLILQTVPLRAIERRVKLEDAPFIPCTVVDLVTYNQSLINKQLSWVSRGENVDVIAWEKGNKNVLVVLKDGSRGYMPALSFIKGGVSLYVTGNSYWACPYYDLSKSRGQIRYSNYLSAGQYRIIDGGDWGSEKRGFQCGFMVVSSTSNNSKYFVCNSTGKETYARIDFKSYCDKSLQALPYEESPSGSLFFERYGKNSVESYVGLSVNELKAVLGEPDAQIAASRSRKKFTELFYKNVCYVDMSDKNTYDFGAVFYADKSGTIVGADRDAFLSRPKGSVKCFELPSRNADGSVSAERIEHKETPFESFDAFNELVANWFGGRWEKLLKLLLITALLCWLENVKFRINAKIGSNKTALRTSVVIPGIIMLYLFLVTTGPSSLMNILTFLLIAAIIYGTQGWNADFVMKNRCEKCRTLVSPKDFKIVSKSAPYSRYSYTRKELGTHYGSEFVPLGDGFKRVTETKTTDFEDRKYTFIRQDQTLRKDCPHCGHSWTYPRTVTLKSKMEVTDRFSTQSFNTYVKGQIQNIDTGEWITVYKTGKNEVADGNGRVYEQYRDGYYHLGDKRYW